MKELRQKLIRLANNKPELRKHLLPLLKESSQEKEAIGEPIREGTLKEFQQAIAKAGYPKPRIMQTKRTYDAEYSDRGTFVASKSQILSRGKVQYESYMVNTDYL